ncbi:DNA cytosine methyltransferase [Microvirga soli]|uniref:DNA cytosine methyltransferase n=1 Tax=Microvirga soli TaxID=1854496 RepID=UPI00191DF8F2|nr:DNA cytosine methyltransferase [Microvirga soli]
MAIRILDLFCGAGGSSAGAKMAGARIVGGIDMDPIATATFADNFRRAVTETRRLDEKSLPGRHLLEGSIDLLLASPECTNHSPAKGARERDEASKKTSHYVISFAERLRPRWIVLENVVQLRNWHGYSPLIEGLEDLGYKIRPQILDAAEFGVPQTRRRLFVMADLDGMPPEIRSRTKKRPFARDIVRLDGTWEARPLRSANRASATLERAERGIAALGPGVPFLIVYYGSDGSGGWQPLDRPLRTLTTLDRFGLVTWEGREPMLRMLQVPELKAAMGLPEAFRLEYGSRRDKIRLIGNGVAPPVMRAVIEGMAGQRKQGRNSVKL